MYCLKLLLINLWWVHVIVIPDVNKIIVFSRGIKNGLNTWIPVGGQLIPNSINCVNDRWKNLQKNEIKKKISEIINKIIPIFIPLNTLNECNPWNVLSRITSRHHWYIINITIKIPKKFKIIIFCWNNLILPNNKIITLNALVNGHGL